MSVVGAAFGEVTEMKKRRKENYGHRLDMNSIEVAGIDLGEAESTVTLLSGSGDVKDTFSFTMDPAFIEF